MTGICSSISKHVIVFVDEKKFNLDGPDDFQKYWHAKYFPEDNYSTRHSGGRFLMIEGGFSSSEKLKHVEHVVCGRQKAEDYVKMLKDLFLAQEEGHLCGEEWNFQQDKAAVHDASTAKNYSVEQKKKKRLLEHHFNPIENL